MSFRIQHFKQEVTIQNDTDTAYGANVENLNGLVKAISVSAPDLDGSSFTLSVLGPNSEVLFSKASLTKDTRTPITVDANNHPLDIPLALNGVPVIKIKSAGTADAAGTLTIDGDDATIVDGDLVVINGVTNNKTYRFKNTTTAINDIKIVPHVAATAVLTSDETQVSDGSIVTAGTIPYVFKTALTDGIVANEVLIGSDADDTLNNFKKAVNGEAGGGTNYGSATVANPDVSCGAVTAHAVTLTARVAGTVGNALAKSEDDPHLDFDGAGATFTGGLDKGFETLENLKLAIGATGAGNGTDYHAGTLAHADVTASRTDDVLTVTAVEAIEDGADITTTTTSGVLTWGAGTLQSGGETEDRVFNVDLLIDRG